MNRIFKTVLSTIATTVFVTMGLSATASAGEVEVTWKEPAKFTDIRPAEQDKDKFEAALYRNFDGIFAELAKKLPDGVRWHVTITDLDLAGEVKPVISSGQDMRVVTQADRPAITFSSRMVDAQNQLINEEQVDLKDLNFLSRSANIIGNDRKLYPYEEFMISQWFERQQSSKVFPQK
jgi:hypothetical protein